MAVPRNRHSTSRRNTRRAHDALDKSHVTRCSACAEPKMPHRVCGSCGTYRGRKLRKTDGE